MTDVVCIMGPTAVGKTEFALTLAKALPVHLISVDSALVYRGMDIGTAKPESAVLSAYPHALVDICNPQERYSVARFVADAQAEIERAKALKLLPVLVGGTSLYFNAMLHGLSDMPARDEALRQSLSLRAEQEGWPALHAELKRNDPLAAEKIHPNDAQRIQRALEVFLLTGVPMSRWQSEVETPFAHLDTLVVALEPPQRPKHHGVIAARFEAMMSAGFLHEVEGFFKDPTMSASLPSMRAVGYRQLWQHLAGDLGLVEAKERAVIATRQLAKRQMTWLRQIPVDLWLKPHAAEELLKVLNQSPASGSGA